MDRGRVSGRIAALRTECAALGREVADGGRSLDPAAAFELAGEAQGLANAADGLVAVAAAYGARVETTLTESGPWERTHPVGFVDAMAAAETSLATGLTEGVAGRKVALGAALSARFPRTRDLVLAGDVAAVTAHKVVDACAGLDLDACGRVDAELSGRLADLDPARVTAEARRVAARVAADQVAAQAARTRRARTVEVRAGEDGLTDWWAVLPTATSAAAWAAVEALAADYRDLDPDLGVPESRADAFGDLLLRDVTVSAQVTLGIPVVTGAPDPASGTTVREELERHPDEVVVDAFTGEETRFADLSAESQEALSWIEHDAQDDPRDVRAVVAPVGPGVAVSGTHLAGLGWVDAATLAGLLRAVPMDVARAVLDARAGTLASLTTDAYRPSRAVREFVTARDGTCRMWGCSRPADRCDLDHTRPWPAGATTPTNLAGLCRRHHRMKQQGRWRYRLFGDGTVTWVGPTGRTRTTEPQHRLPA